MLPLSILLLAACQATKPPPPPPAPIVKLPVPPHATHSFVFDPERDSVVGELQVTQALPDDTLSDIARRFNIGYEEIVRANPTVDQWLPRAGTTIVLPTEFVLPDAPRSGIVINLAAMRLYYFPPHKKNELQTVITHPIGIGMIGWATPLGSAKVIGKRANPVWNPPSSVRKEHAKEGDPLPKQVPPGPDNPLGKYALALDWPSYFIHGTNQPYGVGIRASHGCIRLYPEDIASLYDDIPIGTKVTVVNQPILYGYRGDQEYLQTFPIYDDYPKPKKPSKSVAVKNKSNSKAAAKAPVPTKTTDAEKTTDAAKTTNVAKINESAKAPTTAASAPIKTATLPGFALASEATQHPRGITVPVAPQPATMEAYLASIRLVENRVPAQATWDGLE